MGVLMWTLCEMRFCYIINIIDFSKCAIKLNDLIFKK